MIFDKTHQVDAIVSKDITRIHLTQAHLDIERKRLEATNGHMAVSTPVEIEPGDVSGPVSVDALQAARKAAGRAPTASIHCNGSLAIPSGPTFPRPDLQGMKFPPLPAVIPAVKPGDPGTFTINFNVEYLHRLAKAIGTDGAISLTVELEKDGDGNPILKENLNPIVVTGSNPAVQAVLMPRRR
jgi:hypothetical protein